MANVLDSSCFSKNTYSCGCRLIVCNMMTITIANRVYYAVRFPTATTGRRPAACRGLPRCPIGDVGQKFMNGKTFLWLNEQLGRTAAHPQHRCRHRRAHPYFNGTAERRVAERAPATSRNVSRLWIIHSRWQRSGD